jgi:hypothetical protein
MGRDSARDSNTFSLSRTCPQVTQLCSEKLIKPNKINQNTHRTKQREELGDSKEQVVHFYKEAVQESLIMQSYQAGKQQN